MNKPVFGTTEWSSSNENLFFGCQHDCKYCYAKAMAPRHGKIDIKDWDKPILRPEKLKKAFGKRKGTIMFPTTHDIHPDNLEYVCQFLHRMLLPGNKVLIVSKPHLDCIRTICSEFEDFKDQILFRFTIGSAVNLVLNFWEPGAPDLYERIAALRHAYYRGFKTSVSCEPMLDEMIHEVVLRTVPFVNDSIWLGKMNDTERRLKINGVRDQIPKPMMDGVTHWDNDQHVWDLYNHYKNHPRIKFKESIKKVIGLDIPTEKGMDI